MHELALSESLLSLIEQSSAVRGFRRVRRVRVEIGRLSSVHAPSMQMCFSAVSRGTIAEDAVLEIVDLVGKGVCAGCGARVEVMRFFMNCPSCGSSRIRVSEGTGMRLKELVVE
jgi:hydrogenase nickel incorporation protein HypA/HybF